MAVMETVSIVCQSINSAEPIKSVESNLGKRGTSQELNLRIKFFLMKSSTFGSTARALYGHKL